MALFCIATCHRAEVEIADKYTKVVKLQTHCVALYRKDHKLHSRSVTDLEVRDRSIDSQS